MAVPMQLPWVALTSSCTILVAIATDGQLWARDDVSTNAPFTPLEKLNDDDLGYDNMHFKTVTANEERLVATTTNSHMYVRQGMDPRLTESCVHVHMASPGESTTYSSRVFRPQYIGNISESRRCDIFAPATAETMVFMSVWMDINLQMHRSDSLVLRSQGLQVVETHLSNYSYVNGGNCPAYSMLLLDWRIYSGLSQKMYNVTIRLVNGDDCQVYIHNGRWTVYDDDVSN